MLSRSSMLVIAGLGIWVGLGLAQDKAPAPAAPAKTDDAAGLSLEMSRLALQYAQAMQTVKKEAGQRDQLAMQAQSAIIRMKDAELQAEQAIGAARAVCGNLGKTLKILEPQWSCEVPKPPDKSRGKETPK